MRKLDKGVAAVSEACQINDLDHNLTHNRLIC